MGAHHVAGGQPAGRSASTNVRRQARLRTMLIVAASITWLFTVICLIGLIADGDPDGRLGFVILGLPFLAAALACTYGARALSQDEQVDAGEISRAAQGRWAPVSVATPDELSLDNLPAQTTSALESMRRSYADLDAKLAGAERDREAWQTMTQIVCSIVPTTVSTYRKVAGNADADAEFVRAVGMLSRSFDERRAVVTGGMLDDLRIETRYIEDRFKPSELTVDNPPDKPNG